MGVANCEMRASFSTYFPVGCDPFQGVGSCELCQSSVALEKSRNALTHLHILCTKYAIIAFRTTTFINLTLLELQQLLSTMGRPNFPSCVVILATVALSALLIPSAAAMKIDAGFTSGAWRKSLMQRVMRAQRTRNSS
jgi:hypothetical protein